MVSAKLKQVILSQLRLDEWEVQDDTTAASVPGWDSLSHAGIIAAVEEAFGVRFHIAEIFRLKNVGQLQALLDRKAR